MFSAHRAVTVRLFCICFLIICHLNVFSQRRDSIIYLTPDIVNNKVAEYLRTSNQTGSVYASLHHNKDTVSILVSTYNENFNKLAYIIKASNRFIKISPTRAIPVILQEDALMSTTLRTPKNKGTEYEAMETTVILASGFLIEYKGVYFNASLIRAEYFQN